VHTSPDVLRHANDLREAARAMSATVPRLLPAGLAGDVIAETRGIAEHLPLALARLGEALSRTLAEGVDANLTADIVRVAERHLDLAAAILVDLNAELMAAQLIIEGRAEAE